MKYYIILCFLLWGTLHSYSQHTLEGRITDQSSGEPIAGASVYIQSEEKGAITDFEGYFSIESLSPGTYELLVSYLGYGTRTEEIEIPQSEPVSISLLPTAIEMEEVIISTPFHQLQSENVMKVERLTQEALSRNGSLSLSHGISQLAGVETISSGPGTGKPVIRGLSGNRVLVYAQGVRLENQQFGAEHGLGLSGSGVESVEVIKGPASLLYGSDALGGVLYLNPERYLPADSSLVAVESSYSTNTLGLAGGAAYKSSAEQWRFLLRGKYATHSDYQTGGGTRVSNTRFNEADIKTGVGYRGGDYKGDLRYNFNSARIGIPQEIESQTTEKEVRIPYQWVSTHVLSLDNRYNLPNSLLDLKLGYTFNDRKEFESEEHHHVEESPEEHAAHEEDPALEMHLQTLSYDLKYHLPKLGDLKTIIGLQGMWQTNTNFGEEELIPDANTADLGLMATAHYHFPKLDIQGGIRYDHRSLSTEMSGEVPVLERSFNSYNGALGAKFNMTEEFSARVNLASGFRAPNLAELTSFGSHHGANRFEVGNALLKNEQNYQLDLALEYRNQHFEVFANGFWNQMKHYIYLQPTGEIIEENPVFQYVQDDAFLYGGEAGLHLHPHPLDWLHFESSFETVVGEKKDGGHLPLIPAPSLQNSLRVEFFPQSRLDEIFASFGVKKVFEQTRTGTFETPSPGYTLLNASVGTRTSLGKIDWELHFSGTNLLNKRYISHLSRFKPDGILNMGRNVNVELKLLF